MTPDHEDIVVIDGFTVGCKVPLEGTPSSISPITTQAQREMLEAFRATDPFLLKTSKNDLKPFDKPLQSILTAFGSIEAMLKKANSDISFTPTKLEGLRKVQSSNPGGKYFIEADGSILFFDWAECERIKQLLRIPNLIHGAIGAFILAMRKVDSILIVDYGNIKANSEAPTTLAIESRMIHWNDSSHRLDSLKYILS